MREPHSFSRFVRILGRGKTLTRSLTETEAEEAMGVILDGNALPEQIGAFLMLLRVKEESPEEIAGFVRAARARLSLPTFVPKVDVDWSSYAGKKRQLPWFLLAALRLASAGWRVMMHGGERHTEGRLYTSAALGALGVSPDHDLVAASRRLERENFAYVTIDRLSPQLDDMLGLKPILGLRSPVNSFVRMLNPFAAPVMLQGVFHPAYMHLHRNAGRLLGQRTLAVLRGEGGEIERRPSKPCDVFSLNDGAYSETRWPARLDDPRQEADEGMDLARLGAVWRGEIVDAYADAAIEGTLAIALHALGVAVDVASAEAMADELWRSRDKRRLQTAA